MRAALTLLFLILSFYPKAQTDSVYTGRSPDAPSAKPSPPKDREWLKKFTFGGNFQVGVYPGSTFIYLSPTIGYMLLPKLNVGVGVVYNYINYRYVYGRRSQTLYGGHSFARYMIIPRLFLVTQYDRLRQPDYFSAVDRKVWVNYWLAGVGFSQPLGNNVALSSSIMFNLTPHPLSIYSNRVIVQFGITANL